MADTVLSFPDTSNFQRITINMNAKNYEYLDYLKTIACFLVVCLHFPFGIYGNIINVWARIAVPIFFLCSGFFMKSNFRRKTIHYLKILLLISAVYYGYYIVRALIHKEDLMWIIKSLAYPQFIVLHIGEVCGHLWYVRALIYVTLLFGLCKRFFKNKDALFMAIFLLVSDIITVKYSLLLGIRIWNPGIQEIITKFFGTALPYTMIGLYIRKNEDICKALIKRHQKLLSLIVLFLLFLNVIEYQYLENRHQNVMPANYICTVFIALTVFLLFAFNEKKLPFHRALSLIGRKYSAYIYYFHLLVGLITDFLYRKLPYFNSNFYWNPITIYIETLLVVYICKRVIAKLNQI